MRNLMDSNKAYVFSIRMPQPEISYDLIMEPNMGFVEGTYRLAGGDWQVFIFTRSDVAEPQCRPNRWQSGVSGVVVKTRY
jgi:hypothetical protein